MKFAYAVSMLFILTSLTGCFGQSKPLSAGEELHDYWDIETNNLTWYHFPGGIDVFGNQSIEFSGRNIPMSAQGTYYGIGMSTFEPTMGITSDGNLYMTSWGNGPSGSTAIVQCSGLTELRDVNDYSCVNVYDPLFPVPNSNDPYVYVDKWTDRIMKFDMHALLGMTVEFSDDAGSSWENGQLATSIYSVQDHQTIGSAKLPAVGYDTTWVFCVNGNAPHPLCSSSFDGGRTWTPEVSGAPVDCGSGGLTAHIEGGVNGNFYRGNKGCSGSGYSVYRSTNGGLTWTEHPLPTQESGTADTWNGEEAQVAVDDSGNVHAFWMGLDDMPYWAYSRNAGDTWSDAMMIAPPINLSGTGFPVVAAGYEGTVVFGYVGETPGQNETWNAYLTYATDAFNTTPLLTTVQINGIGDPIDVVVDCGYNRCGGLGDFLDIAIDSNGRTWFALSHNIADIGIFATLNTGTSLKNSDLILMSDLPKGGPMTL